MKAGDRPAGQAQPPVPEQRLVAILDAIDAIVWEADAQTLRFTYVSPRAESMLGYPRDAWLEDGFMASVVHPEDREDMLGFCQAEPREGWDHDVEYRVIAADGRTLWILNKIEVLRDASGEVSQLRGVMIDVTESRLAGRRMAVQLATTRVLAEAKSLAETIPRVLQGVCEALFWAGGDLWLLDEASGTLRCEEVWMSPDLADSRFVAEGWEARLNPGQGLAGRAWQSGEPVWIEDLSADDRLSRSTAAAEAGLHAAFAFPVRGHEKLLGAVEFFARRVHRLDQELMDMVSSIGAQVGQYIEHRNIQSEVLFQKTLMEFQSESSLDGILVVGATGRVLFHNRRLGAMWGLEGDLTGELAREAVLEPARRRLADPTPIERIMDSLVADPERRIRDELELSDGRILDVYCAPVVTQDGAYYGRSWCFRDVTPERSAARILAENQERLSFLARASALLASSLDVQGTLERLTRLVVQQLGDWSVVDVLGRDGQLERASAAHADPARDQLVNMLRVRFPLVAQQPIGPHNVARTGQPELYAEVTPEMVDMMASSPDHRVALEDLGLSSIMCVPLVARGRILGALTVVSSDPERRFDESDVSLVRDLALRAALAMDNARLYSERARVAKTLQQSLLPPASPRIPGLDVAARFHPAGDGTEIGGDFYDVFQTRETSWAVTVGDVVGKGTEAATITALARYTLRAATMNPGKPSEILRTLNDALLGRDTPDKYCTAVLAQVEPSGNGIDVLLSCGGHPAPYVVRAGGEVEKLDCLGTVLGLFQDVTLRDSEVHLGPGDAIVLFTDGVTEGRGPTVPFGEGMLQSLLQWSAGSGAEELAGLIESKVLEYQQGWASDDIAVLVIRVPPVS